MPAFLGLRIWFDVTIKTSNDMPVRLRLSRDGRVEGSMPIYEYICSRCAHEFEVRRPISEAGEPTRCPSCRATAKKQISAFGSKDGFYMKTSSPTPFRSRPAAKGKKRPSSK